MGVFQQNGWVGDAFGLIYGWRVVNEAFLEARTKSSGTVGGERGARPGGNEEL